MKTYEQKLKKWVNDQKDDRTFDYSNHRNCLLCQFCRETEAIEVTASGYFIALANSPNQRIWEFSYDLAIKIVEGCKDLRILKQFLNDNVK